MHIEAGNLCGDAGQSMAASFNSTNVLETGDIDTQAALQIDSAVGTRAGTLYLETSNDEVTWVALWWTDSTGATVTSILVAAGILLADHIIVNSSGKYIRGRYSDATGGAGAGTLFIRAHRKRSR